MRLLNMSAITENRTETGAFTLELALEGLSKDVLTTIRKQAAIKNASSLNREKLKLAIIEKLPLAYQTELNSILVMLDQERISILDEVVRRKGILPDTNQFNEQQLKYWLELGLLFRTTLQSKPVVAMPEQLLEVVAKQLADLDRKVIQLNTTLIETIKGMLYYYGALSHEQAGQLLEQFTMFTQLKAPFMHIIINYRHYHNDLGLNEQYLFHTAIPDPSFIIKEQQQREELSFAYRSALELQKAGAAGYIDRTQAYQLFVDCLMKQLKVQEQDAHLLAGQAEFGIRAGLQLQDLVEYLKRQVIIEDEQTLNLILPRLIIMYNHTAQWLLKGHHAAELTRGTEGAPVQSTVEAQSLATSSSSIQIGRNDPCHCGSGKKFKKCCLNK